jgi:hypothetical protein
VLFLFFLSLDCPNLIPIWEFTNELAIDQPATFTFCIDLACFTNFHAFLHHKRVVVIRSPLLMKWRNTKTAAIGDKAVVAHDTPPIFDWLLNAFSYQGISDRVAREYMEKHGTASWSDIQASLRNKPSCPKLRNYWSFDRCRYDKTSFTCSEPEHIDACPVPRPYLRNGRLNQTAYSLFLFVRDLMDGDIVHWIDTQLAAARSDSGTTLAAIGQEALIGPLRNIYGVSDKVLMMTLSTLLIGARKHRLVWFETGTAMIAIDTQRRKGAKRWLIRCLLRHLIVVQLGLQAELISRAPRAEAACL